MKQSIIIFVLFFTVNGFISKLVFNEKKMSNKKLEKITLGNGCFWCTEAVFEKLDGVISAVSGYSGGTTENPTYKEVCTGKTGHAEVIQVTFDSSKISIEKILEVFFKTHDPTTLNRQGNDVGTQYRSVIFYHNAKQKEIAEQIKDKLDNAKIFNKPIVTQITKFTNFYLAENYHQNYYELNKSQPYCEFVITPKIEKFNKVFKELLKK
ncbi:MAG: peptide-methionine (S)-S-oxide reductase [Ignavibacteriae bacterium]|nr:MAG: peptide-methionine (S)-S-oxide reductase [Ignavibacteriota bacterium]